MSIVLGLCSLLLAFLLFMEWRRVNRARLFWRLFASIIMVGALACLGLPLYSWRDMPVGAGVSRVDTSSGVAAMDWPRKLERGDSLIVRGRWRGRPARLLLMGMGEVVDSMPIDSGAFLLGTVPASLGRAVYSLAGVVGKDTVEREDVPVEVRMASSLKILLLAASPDFENSFLIKWLGERGHSVASRTMVSRGKAQEAFVNRESSVLAPLTAAMLGGFDVVIADAAALPARGTTEWGVLRRQVEEKGLGLILKVDSAGLDSMRRRASRALVRDSAGRVVVGAMMEGAGKVVFSGDNTSYSQLLAGEKKGYAAYWSGLLRQVARRGDWVDEWSFQPALPRVGEEVTVQLQTGAAMPQGILGGTTVYMAQDRELGFLWRGKYWPEKAGWQAASRPGGDTAWWYVWPGRARGVVSEERIERVRVEFPKGWFAGLFVLGAVFLWVERKMGGMNG